MKPPFPEKSLPAWRRQLHFVGLVLIVLGGISFGSTFITFAAHFGDFDNFAGNARSDMLRAAVGMFLMIGGGVVMGVARGGMAGAGLTLDPDQAREDLEPWAQMSGQLTNTAINQIDLAREAVDRLGGEVQPPAIKVRCRACQALNDETDRFCGQCGSPI